MCRARGGTGPSRGNILLTLQSVLSGSSVEGMSRWEGGQEGRESQEGRGVEEGRREGTNAALSLAGQPEGLWNKNHSV